MDQAFNVEILIHSILLLHDESSIKKTFATIRKALEEAVRQGLISPKIMKQYLDLKRFIINGESEMNSSIFIPTEELRDIATPLIKNNKWTTGVLFFFRSVPKDKYISKHFISELLDSWSVLRFGGKSWRHSHDLICTLARLSRDGYLERVKLNGPEYSGKENLDKKLAFCTRHVHGTVRAMGSGQTQSVFRLTKDGEKHIARLIKFS